MSNEPNKVYSYIGARFTGFCGGYFSDSYGEKTVEAMGYDWVVVRENRYPMIATFSDHNHMIRELNQWLQESEESE